MADDQGPARTPRPPGSNCNDLTDAALGAEQLISRVQDIVTEGIQPDGDPGKAFDDVISEVDPGPEGTALRTALGMSRAGSRDIPDKPSGDPAPTPRKHDRIAEASPDDAPPEYKTWRTGP